jgi:hypothetical protein
MPDAELLLEYMRRFVGFGTPDAPLWFIGLEQGGGETLDELHRRLTAWQDVGAPVFADFPEYCRQIGESRWHGPAARIQPTLGRIIRIVLASRGIEATPERIRRYQAEAFATAGGETMIGELMPLPSRTVSDWIYGATGIPSLSTRTEYVRRFQPQRVALLREAINVAKPRAVIFLGITALETWKLVAGLELVAGAGGALWGNSTHSRFVVSRHPTAFGARNSDFEAIGHALRL